LRDIGLSGGGIGSFGGVLAGLVGGSGLILVIRRSIGRMIGLRSRGNISIDLGLRSVGEGLFRSELSRELRM